MLEGTDSNSKGLAYTLPSLKNSQDYFTLIDIGCSGGIDSFWDQFGSILKGFGIDPLVTEIERLNKINMSKTVNYYDAWITDGTHEPREIDQIASSIFNLSSARYADKIKNENYQEINFNHGKPLSFSEKKMTLDEFVAENNIDAVDFIKIDTDGHDFFVLEGAKETLAHKKILGIQIECQFHGTPDRHNNTFANIDNFLRENGFFLFDMDVWKYSRHGLPQKFYYDLHAQTVRGQVLWAEALYLVDPVIDKSCLDDLLQVKNKLIKLLGLYAAFGLVDCAATLALQLEEQNILLPNFSYKEFLDQLVPDTFRGIHTYEAYIKHFENDPSAFYKSSKDKPTLPLNKLKDWSSSALNKIKRGENAEN